MKILFLPKYDKDGPSSRYRTFQYLQYYNDFGIDCVVFPFFSYGYISSLNAKSSVFFYMRGIFRRMKKVFSFYKYDLIVIEKELIPYFPSILEYILFLFKKKYILDFDDAIYVNYSESSNCIVRFFLKNKIKKIISWASGVITGSPELTAYAKKYNKKVVEIPTSIDLVKYSLDSALVKAERFVIGWIGGRATSKHIEIIKPALDRFLFEYDNVYLHLIGYSGNLFVENEHIKIISWSSITEVEELGKIDIGVMPLVNQPFERGKCGFKLIQYMACSKPTISTPLLANVKIDNGIGNLFATSQEEWFSCLEEMYNNRRDYCEIGSRNRKIVLQEYSIQSNYLKYISFFKAIQDL